MSYGGMAVTDRYHCLAVLDDNCSTQMPEGWLEQELLNYLDDQHQPVEVLRLKRLPAWIQRAAWLTAIYLGLKLMAAPCSLIFVEGKLLSQLGMMFYGLKKLKRHILITVGATLGQYELPNNKPDSGPLMLGLRASDYYFIDSEELRAWLMEQHIDQIKIKLMKNTLIYRTQGPSLTWVYHHVQTRTIKKIRQRQFGKFFKQMSEISFAK